MEINDECYCDFASRRFFGSKETAHDPICPQYGKCNECDGTGEKFILPRGNPFNMKLPQLAAAMVKVRCFQCHGTGQLAAHTHS